MDHRSLNAARLVESMVATLLLAFAPLSHPCSAQMPGQPVIQNAFSNPGITVGVNVGRSSNDANGFAGAAAWAPSNGGFQLSIGGGVVRPNDGESVFAWGARAMLPIPLLKLGDRFGIAAFTGAGGASDQGVSQLNVPAGVAVGYRRAIGSSRGVSAYAAPFYSWSRTDSGDASEAGGKFRVSFGADITVVRKIGLTIGYETGAEARAGEAGPSGDIFGVGLSYAFR